MTAKSKIKITTTQYWVMEQIRTKGPYPVKNSQNPTAKRLIEIGVCEWNRHYNALVFTELGKTFEL